MNGVRPAHDMLDEQAYHWLHAERSSSASIAEWMPRCKPGDPGIYVGGMLVGGCPGERR